jgi:hypothetical protein
VERTFDPENAETYTTLRYFTKKYTVTPPEKKSWGAHTVLEVTTFQKYDAPDFRNYLNLKCGGLENEGSMECSFRMSNSSSESTLPTSTGSASLVSKPSKVRTLSKGKIGINGCSTETRGKPTCTENHEDQTSMRSSKSSRIKARFKAVFKVGSKEKSSSSQANGKSNTERTKVLLEIHNDIIPAGKANYI